METERKRAAAFFIHYLLLLLYVPIWLNMPHVAERVPVAPGVLWGAYAVAVCYVLARAWLVLRRPLGEGWDYLWLTLDVGIISVAVRYTGRVDSEAALAYFLPIATSSIQRRPGRTVSVGVLAALLYVAVVGAWSAPVEAHIASKLVGRVYLLLLVTSLAACYAFYESARVEEMARLREQVALSDYRTRLSREMHDGILHYLMDIGARLQLARLMVDREPAQAARLAVDQGLTVRQASDELRYLVRRLRSPAIERQGVVAALRDHLSMVGERSGMSVRLDVEGSPASLPPDVEHAGFRIVQEALTNAEKHAGATEVKVTLDFDGGGFRCTVADDGVGFHPAEVPSEPSAEGGFGLASMRQRAEAVGGRLEVSSAPGEGTAVTFAVPVSVDAASAREAA